ncbi:MAG: glycosyl hydrolase family 65 protein, partial [Polyangiales bacterium]
SWYTGSAAWFWRLGIEVILVLRRVGGGLRIDPRIPADWPGFHATIRTEGGVLEIEVENPHGSGHGLAELLVDGEPIDGEEIPLPNDGKTHEVRVRLRGYGRGT